MTGVWVAAIALGVMVLGVAKAVMGDMVREEARTRLGRIPSGLITLAGRRVSADIREDITAEWNAELEFMLTGTDGMPLTRLARGIRYSAGLLLSARKIAGGLGYRDQGLIKRITRILLRYASRTLSERELEVSKSEPELQVLNAQMEPEIRPSAKGGGGGTIGVSNLRY